jgi:hypothetical protein
LIRPGVAATAALLSLALAPTGAAPVSAQLPVRETLPSPCLWPGPITWDDGVLLAAREGFSLVYRVPALGGAIDSFDVGSGVRALQMFQDTLWVLSPSPFRLRAHDPLSGSPRGESVAVEGGSEIHDLAVDAEGALWASRIDGGSGGIVLDRLDRGTGRILASVVPSGPSSPGRLGITWTGDRLVLMTDIATYRYAPDFSLLQVTPMWDLWRLNPGIGLAFDGTDLWAGASESTLEGPKGWLVRFGMEPVAVDVLSWGAIKRRFLRLGP